jgi:hypothetical protein
MDAAPQLISETERERRRKIGLATRGRVVTWGDKISKAKMGKSPSVPVSQDARKNLSLALLGKPKSEEHRKKIGEGRKGMVFSDQHKANISKGKMGSVPWNKGKPGLQVCWNKGGTLPAETRKKISETLTGRVGTNKGKKFSQEWCRKIGAAKAGQSLTEEHKKKIGDAIRGEKNGFYGKKHRPETLAMLSELKRGEKSPAWNGGSSFLPYSPEFGKRIKKYIKTRDGYACQICGKGTRLSVHHIDYDKLNTDEHNLISLCQSCHGKTIYNRDSWKMFFKGMIEKMEVYQ